MCDCWNIWSREELFLASFLSCSDSGQSALVSGDQLVCWLLSGRVSGICTDGLLPPGAMGGLSDILLLHMRCRHEHVGAAGREQLQSRRVKL